MAADTETIAEAQGMLATARDVCHDLGIKWIPNQLAFSEVTMIGDPTRRHSQPWYRDVPSDHPSMQGDILVVAPSMKGRLSPAEWKPIVAASMIYYAKLNTRKILGIIVLLSALARYGETISATGYPRKRLQIWPTVNQRIERLQKPPPG